MGVPKEQRGAFVRDKLADWLSQRVKNGEIYDRLMGLTAYYAAISVVNNELTVDSMRRLCEICDHIPTADFNDLAVKGELHAVYEVAICCVNEPLFIRAWPCRKLDKKMSLLDETIYHELAERFFRKQDLDIVLKDGTWLSRLALKPFSGVLDRFVVFEGEQR